MISTQKRKAMAIAAGVALIGATLTGGAPAMAAAGDLSFKPTTGSSGNYNVFNSDSFALTTVVNTIAVANDATLAYKIELTPDAKNEGVVVSFPNNTNANVSIAVNRFKASGEEIDTVAFALSNATDDFYIDFYSDGSNSAQSAIVSFTTAISAGHDLTPVFEVVGETTASKSTGASTANTARAEHGDGDSSITVTAWLDLDSNFKTIESTYQAGPQVINFFDPNNVSVVSSIERMTATGFTLLASSGASARQDFVMDAAGAIASQVTGRMSFNKPVNYEQIDLTQWKVGTSGTVSDVALRDIKLRGPAAADDALDESDSNFEVLLASNGKPASVNGELLFRVFAGTQTFEAGEKIQVNFKHSDADETSTYSSPQFTFVTNSVASTANNGTLSASPTEFSTAISSNALNISSGVTDFTYTVQATDGAASVKTANIPVVARVEATSFLTKGEVLTVSGSSSKIDQANEAVYVSGLTNSDGKFSVTVSASSATTGTNYNVQFYIANGTSGNAGDFVAITEFTATYAAAAATGLTPVNSVSSAANPVLGFTVKDAFGEGISLSPKGDQYSVELTAPDTDDLKAYAQVAADGTVSFTFANWLSTGESELLTAKLYTGTSTSPAAANFTGDEASVTLYAPVAGSAINLNVEKITGMVIEYNDFITGKKDKVGPTTTVNSQDVAGNVVDANGAGIPGTPVTLSADGVQFYNGSTYSIGTVDLVTDAAGSFTAEIWVQEKSTTGITLTASAGTLSDSLAITSVLPQSNVANRGNLLFSADLPANVVVNTTYAVTATVTDVFGNPVNGASVKFDGFGSAQFNGLATTTRLTDRNGEAVAYLRSLKDIDGLSSIEISVVSIDHDGDGVFDVNSIASAVSTDVKTTSWDESAWSNIVEAEVNFLTSASLIPSTDTKVNAGSFKGYVAVYAKGYEGQRLSAKIGNDWVIVPSLASSFERIVDFTGAGVDISVRIYIDRVLLDTIELTTK